MPATAAPATTTTDLPLAVAAAVPGPSLAARLGAELFGTFVVLLAGLGTALYASYTGAQTLGVALAFGLATVAAFLAVGRVSGGHFNPAITLGAALAGRTRWAHVPLYWIAQVVSGALVAALLFVVVSSFPALDGAERQFFSSAANGYDAASPLAMSTGSPEGFTLLAALLIEAVATAVLVGVYLGVTDRRAEHHQAAFGVGLALAIATLVAVPVTNAGLNPARSTAAAIFAEDAWGQLWVFWVAPLVGAAVAALLYRAFAPAGDDDDLLDEDLELDEVEPTR